MAAMVVACARVRSRRRGRSGAPRPRHPGSRSRSCRTGPPRLSSPRGRDGGRPAQRRDRQRPGGADLARHRAGGEVHDRSTTSRCRPLGDPVRRRPRRPPGRLAAGPRSSRRRARPTSSRASSGTTLRRGRRAAGRRSAGGPSPRSSRSTKGASRGAPLPAAPLRSRHRRHRRPRRACGRLPGASRRRPADRDRATPARAGTVSSRPGWRARASTGSSARTARGCGARADHRHRAHDPRAPRARGPRRDERRTDRGHRGADPGFVERLEDRLAAVGPRRGPVIGINLLIWVGLALLAAVAWRAPGPAVALPLLAVTVAYLPALLLLTLRSSRASGPSG